jgi:hypothetical protein
MPSHPMTAEAAKAPETGAGWQPIETVPKDGTIIDLWHEEWGRYSNCKWGFPDHCCGEAESYCDSEWHGMEEDWVDTTFNEVVAGPFTHWMPLPAAPDAPQPTPSLTEREKEMLEALRPFAAIGNEGRGSALRDDAPLAVVSAEMPDLPAWLAKVKGVITQGDVRCARSLLARLEK